MLRTALCLALTVAAYVPHAMAQDVEKCNYAIISNKSQGSYDLREQLSIYNSVTQDDFKNAKQHFGANADFFIGEIPVSGTMNWDKFDEERKKRTSDYRFNFSRKNAQFWNNVYLSPSTPEMYKDCIGALAKGRLRIEINKSALAPDSLNVPIRILFNTSQDDPAFRSLSISEIGGNLRLSSVDATKVQRFQHDLDISAVFTRSSNTADSILSLNLFDNASSAQIVVPAKVKLLVRKSQLRLVDATVSVTHDVPVHHQFKETFCLPLKEEAAQLEGFEPVPGTVKQSVSYNGDGDAQEKGTSIVGNSACGEFNVGTGGASGVTAKMYLRSEFRRYYWEDAD